MTLLLSACGYITEAAESGEEALRIVQKGRLPRIALVDLDLPGMNGLDLIRQLEKLDPSVFPVLITAAAADSLASRLRELRVAYMQKPVNFDRLLSLIHEGTHSM